MCMSAIFHDQIIGACSRVLEADEVFDVVVP